VKFEDPSALDPISGSLFKATARAKAEVSEAPRIVSGYVEASNVNIIEEMANLIYYQHIYTLDTKIVANRDTMLTRAMDMGKPAQ
jgi:flagellar basal-body rod protein FlgG